MDAFDERVCREDLERAARRNTDGRIVAEIASVIVAWDAAGARSRPLTDSERAKLSG